MTLSGCLKVEGVPLREDSGGPPVAQTQTIVATSTPPFKSVVAHRRPGGQSVSVKVAQAHLSWEGFI